MPTYEYICRNCGERFEKVQSFRAKPLRKHDACGGAVQKVFHASGVVFKGSGFYATDSRGSNSDSTTKTDTSDSTTTTAPKNGSKSESKADSTTSSAASD